MIHLIFRQEGETVQRIRSTLREHFGPNSVADGIPRSSLPNSSGESQIAPDCICVCLLEETSKLDQVSKEGGESDVSDPNGCGYPLNDLEVMERSGLPELLKSEAVTIPILLNDLQMPPIQSLPESLRKLAFSHALPLRTDEQFRRDMGRLLRDLQNLTSHAPGKHFAWDGWLIGIGIFGLLLTFPFVTVWYLDFRYWNYDYVSQAQFQNAMDFLLGGGPIVTCASASLLGAGWILRARRRYRARKASYLLAEIDSCPTPPDSLIGIAVLLSFATIAFSWLALVPAIILCTFTLYRTGLRRRSVPAALLCLGLCVAGILSTKWRYELAEKLERAVVAFESGTRQLIDGDAELAEKSFRAGIEHYGHYGNNFLGVARVMLERKDDSEAMLALNQAIERYPTQGRGWFEPSRTLVAEAYQSRAAIHERAGNDKLAVQDRTTASELTPFLDLFAGLGRVWGMRREEYGIEQYNPPMNF